MKTNSASLFVAVFAVLALASFALSLFLPVYTDEIMWKAMQSRMGYDDFHSIGLLVTCDVHEIPTPRLLQPFRLIDTAIYQDISQPFLIRVIGEIFAVVWGFLAWILLRRALAPAISSGVIALGVVSFATLGVMPFLLVSSGPEQLP